MAKRYAVQVECPECGVLMSPQGMPRHLQGAHGLTRARSLKVGAKLPRIRPVATWAEKHMELLTTWSALNDAVIRPKPRWANSSKAASAIREARDTAREDLLAHVALLEG